MTKDSDVHYQKWDSYRGKIRSRKGGWKLGQGVVSHGMDLLTDIVGHYSYMQLVVLNATGRMPPRNVADWIEAAHMCLSYPDPRIWCNRIGALGGTNRTSVVAATCYGVLASDAIGYGIRPLSVGVDFIQDVKKKLDDGESLDSLLANKIKENGGRPSLMGYARPIALGDERIPTLERVTKNLGFKKGKHLTIAFQIDSFLDEHYQETMNMNGYVSAFLADCGYSSAEVYRIFAVQTFSGITACFTDVEERPAGSFSPLRVEDIDYTGPQARTINQ